jgi:hypothetical protein
MVTINELVNPLADIASKAIGKKHVPGFPLVCGGVSLMTDSLKRPMRVGLEPTYRWIHAQTKREMLRGM